MSLDPDVAEEDGARLVLSAFAELDCVPGEILMLGSIGDFTRLKSASLEACVSRACAKGWIEDVGCGQLRLTPLGFRKAQK